MLYYLANVRLPTYRAHGIQMMKMCEALGSAGVPVTLVVPHKRHTVDGSDDPFAYFGVQKSFAIRRVTSLDLLGLTHMLGALFYTIDLISFVISIRLSVRIPKGSAAYVRDPFLFWAVPRGVKRYAEVHEVPKHPQFVSLLKTADHVFALTSALKDDLVAVGLSADRVSVLPDAVDIEAFRDAESQADARKRLGLPLDKSVALYVGRLDGWKGLDTVYEAARLLPDTVAVAVIGGDVEELPVLKHAHPKVVFLGPRPYTELKHNMAAADVLLLPNTAKHVSSARYTSPLKLFAYMTSSRAIVASRLPSLSDILNEHNAFLVPPDDAAALAQGITTLLADNELEEKLGARAKEDVAPYTWENRAKRVQTALSL